MINWATRLWVVGALAAGAGCLDLSEGGKVFACPGCVLDAGAGGGAGTDAGVVVIECSCRLPEASCQGDTRISAAASRCLADAGCEFQLIETVCPGGCALGACVGEPCLGMVCGQAPKARCESATALRVFTSPGACQAGGCLYASAEVSCDCEDGHCKQNPCLGVVCNQPSAPICSGASLRTWQSPGSCDAATGRCSYSLAEFPCGLGGCHEGQCSADKCAGVVCNQPPASTCLSATTARGSVSPGTCNPATGGCSYATQTLPCPAGEQCSQGACTPVSASCNSSNCTGCCNGNSCVPLGSQGNLQCGAAGAACGSCGAAAPVCVSGACISKCAGISCNQPPAPSCLDGTTLTQWSGGSCDPASGACSYSPANVTCGAGNTCAGGACSCVSESEASLCARLVKSCGAVSSNDNCGVPRVVNCGSCTLPQTCNANACSCQPEPDATFCGRLGKNCGTVSGTDNCAAPRTASCGSCAAPETCGVNVCSCTPETTSAFCARLGKNCGTVSAADNCGTTRTTSCGSCTAPQTCGATNVCACVPESNASYCSRLGKNCGTVSGTDNCGAARTASCGSCTSPQSCSANNVCSCVSESTSAFCARHGATCGPLSAADNCGVNRTATCGSCTSPATCVSNSCVCAAETNAAFCTRLGKNCGTVSGTDNCGATRTTTCGSCTSPQSCGGGGVTNVCGGATTRLSFSSSWQTIPNTGSQVVEFMCSGTVSTTASGGTRCSRSSGDPVHFRINGSLYWFYPGCDGDRPSNCMTSITPTGATYADWGLLSAGKLLCDAMGWPWSKGLSDNNPGTVDRAVAVVQTNPSVIGTDPDLKNYSTFVACEP